jgi:hypothetical protein
VTKEAVEKWKAEKRISEDDTGGYHYHSAVNVKMVNSTSMTMTYSMMWLKKWALVHLEAI